MPYDSSKTTIPVMILAGAPKDVISLEGLNDMFRAGFPPVLLSHGEAIRIMDKCCIPQIDM